MITQYSNIISVTTLSGSLLDLYTGAEAAYSLRKLRSGYTGGAIEVRRASDNTTQDIGFVDGQLDTASLEEFVNCEDVAPADYGSGAAAAYSLRYVSASYTGDVIEVRRSSDDTTQDFNPTEITDGTLATFCGVGDGFVTTWYDQSGNSNDATQSTASSQPKIYDSVSGVILENGKPAVQFDGSDDYLINTLQEFITFSIVSKITIDTANMFLGDSNNQYNIWYSSTALSFDGGLSDEARYSINNSSLSSYAENHSISNYLNSQINLFANYDTSRGMKSQFINVGRYDSSFLFNGVIQEIIAYNSDQSSNRPKIEANTNNYYSIYTNTNNGFVTTWYDQSGNGYDATQTTAANQPQIVSSGSVITDNGKPSIDFDKNGPQYFDTGTQIGLANTGSIYVVSSIESIGQFNAHFANGYDADIWVGSIDNNRQLQIWTNNQNSPGNSDAFTLNTQFLASYFLKSGTNGHKIYVNNSIYLTGSKSFTIPSPTNTNGGIGRDVRNDDYPFDGKMQEILFFADNTDADNNGINTNINDFYDIY